MDVEKIIDQQGGDYRIEQVRGRLFCSACRTRSNALRIVYVGPGAKASGFRYRR